MAAYSSRRRNRGSRRASEPEPEEELAPRASSRRSGSRGRDRTREVSRSSAQKSRRNEAAAKLTFLKPLGFGVGAVAVIVVLFMIPGFVRKGRLNALSSPDAHARRKAVTNLVESGSSIVPELKARATSKRATDAACLALGMIAVKESGENALEALIELAGSETAEVRQAATAGLGRSKQAKALETLKKLRSDDVPAIVLEAIGALGAIKGKPSAEILLSIIASGTEEERKAARGALARVADASCRTLFEEALSRPQAKVRAVARELLPTVAEGVSAARIEELLKSESASTRKTAMELAATLGQGDMGKAVETALADEKADVRVAALRAAAARNLRAFAEKAIELLASESEAERAAACEYLGAIYAMKSILPLAQTAAKADAPVEVRRAAFRAIARLARYLDDGKPKFQHPDQEARWVVVEALAPAFEKLPEALEPDAADALGAASGWSLAGSTAAECAKGLAHKRSLAGRYGEARYHESQADVIQASKTRDPKKVKEAYALAVKARDLYKGLFDEAEFNEDKSLFKRLYEEMNRRTGGAPEPPPRPKGAGE